jgi:hypothetical protein
MKKMRDLNANSFAGLGEDTDKFVPSYKRARTNLQLSKRKPKLNDVNEFPELSVLSQIKQSKDTVSYVETLANADKMEAAHKAVSNTVTLRDGTVVVLSEHEIIQLIESRAQRGIYVLLPSTGETFRMTVEWLHSLSRSELLPRMKDEIEDQEMDHSFAPPISEDQPKVDRDDSSFDDEEDDF